MILHSKPIAYGIGLGEGYHPSHVFFKKGVDTPVEEKKEEKEFIKEEEFKV